MAKGKVQALLAGGTPLAVEVVSFCRNILLCRLLPIEEMGQLIILLVSLRLVEMATDLSLRVQMQQAHDGGGFRFQRVIHTAMHVRAFFLSTVLLCMAFPLSLVFGGTPAAETFALMALVPLVKGFEHTDYRRRERAFRFVTSSIVQIGGAVMALMAIPLWISVMDDHRVAVPVVLTHAASTVILSHVLAKRRYRVGFDIALLARIWKFAIPLMGCALLSFAQLQGDRMIIALTYSWEEVARYAIAAQLMLVPLMILTRSSQSMILPVFREIIGSHEARFADTARYAIFLFAGLGVVFALGYAAFANFLLWLFYGQAYQLELPVLLSLGLLGGFRVARIAQVYIVLGLGRPDLHLKATMFQSLGFVMGAIAAAAGCELYLMLVAIALGEGAAYLISHRFLLGLIPSLSNLRPAMSVALFADMLSNIGLNGEWSEPDYLEQGVSQ